MINRLSLILETTHDAIILANRTGEIILWNKASTTLFGYSNEEAIGQNLKLIVPDDYHAMHEAGMSRFVSTGEEKIIGKTVELIAKKKDGSLFPIELSLSSWVERDELFVCGIIRDISVRKKSEENIIDLSAIIDSSPSCLKLIDKNGILLKMNQVGLNIIEADNFEAVRGAIVYGLVNEKDRSVFTKFNERICRGEEGTLIFKITGLKGTEKTMETYARSHKLPNGETAHLSITNDISDRVKTEKELLQKDQALEEASRLTVIGEFAAGIAHEINNPLAIIYGKAQLLEIQLNNLIDLEDEKFERIKKSLNSIIDTVKHTSDIINNLKTFSSSADFQALDYHNLSGIVEKVLNLCENRCADAKIEIIVDIDPDIHVLCTTVGLSQVLMNLILNAFDAVKNLDDRWIKIESSSDNQALQLSLTDSGTGIHPDVKGKILQPFFTTKDPGKGIGLGLSISLNSIKKMKGSLRYNEKHENTQFILEFDSFKL